MVLSKLIKICSLSLVIFCFSTLGYAQDVSQKYEYDEFTMPTLAELYWAVNRQDINDDVHVDNFLRITQCNLFTDYFQNEFEWQEIRAAAKEFLKEKKKTFSVRYQFMQPLKLGEYDLDKKQFEIQEEYQLKGTRRFEVVVSTIGQEVCGINNKIPGYPRSIGIEFSRPVALTDIAVEKDTALAYIAAKQEKFKKLSNKKQTRKALLDLRDVYIVMKVRFFSSQGGIRNSDGRKVPHLLAILERIEVYADQDKTNLLVAKDMIRKRRPPSQKTESQAKTKPAGLPSDIIPDDMKAVSSE